MREAADAGAGSVVTFSSLYEEPGEGPSLRDRLAAIATEHGMAVCGGNGMGFLHLDRRLRVTGFRTDDRLRPGPITLVSHSGSAFAAFGWNDRSMGFNLIVSSGQEVVTTMAEYAEYALEQPTTEVLALLLETVRDPERFRAVLDEAARKDVPVVALVMGRTSASASMVTAHSGALAGQHGAFEALFDATGVHECRTLTEMADTLELFASGRRARPGAASPACTTPAGNARCSSIWPRTSGCRSRRWPRTRSRGSPPRSTRGWRRRTLSTPGGPGSTPTRSSTRRSARWPRTPRSSLMAFVVDMTTQGEPYEEGYLQIALDAAAGTTKPFCVLSNLHSAIAREEVQRLRDARDPDPGGDGVGAPRRSGTSSTMPSGGRGPRSRRRNRRRRRSSRGGVRGSPEASRSPNSRGSPSSRTTVSRWWRPKPPPPPMRPRPPRDGSAIPSPQDRHARHLAQVRGRRRAARARGRSGRARCLRGRGRTSGPEVMVAAMAPPGVEVALGIVRDPMFGPLVLVAAGGVLVELLHDRRLALPPIGPDAARRLIDGLLDPTHPRRGPRRAGRGRRGAGGCRFPAERARIGPRGPALRARREPGDRRSGRVPRSGRARRDLDAPCVVLGYRLSEHLRLASKHASHP